jgi:hypothetical protein
MHEGPRGITTTLVLSGAGTFTLDSAPENVFWSNGDFDSEADWSELVSVAGEWNQDDFDGTVNLTTDSSVLDFPISGAELSSRGNGADLRLFTYVGLVDDRVAFEFTKVDSQ